MISAYASFGVEYAVSESCEPPPELEPPQLAMSRALPSPPGGAPATSDGLVGNFDPAEGKSPLDLFGVRFGQTASTDLTLIIRTYKSWDASIINPSFGRSLCVALRSDDQPK